MIIYDTSFISSWVGFAFSSNIQKCDITRNELSTLNHKLTYEDGIGIIYDDCDEILYGMVCIYNKLTNWSVKLFEALFHFQLTIKTKVEQKYLHANFRISIKTN